MEENKIPNENVQENKKKKKSGFKIAIIIILIAIIIGAVISAIYFLVFAPKTIVSLLPKHITTASAAAIIRTNNRFLLTIIFIPPATSFPYPKRKNCYAYTPPYMPKISLHLLYPNSSPIKIPDAKLTLLLT